MKLFIACIFVAISYAQTAQAGSNAYPYNNQGYNTNRQQVGASGYPGSQNQNRQQGNYPRPNQGYPNSGGGSYPPPTQGGGYNQHGTFPPTRMDITQCTQKRQETCRLKRMKSLCDKDVCCVFEYKDRKPSCYGLDEAPYSQVECKDFPRDTCEKDPSCAWSMTDYECDMKFSVGADFMEECAQNPTNPECMKHGSMISGGAMILFCVGCCCGYFIRPCYANHEKRQKETQVVVVNPTNNDKAGESSWDYHRAPEDQRARGPQDYHASTKAQRSKTPQHGAYYGHTTTSGMPAGEHQAYDQNYHAMHFEP